MSGIEIASSKNLMLFSGRAFPELATDIGNALGVAPVEVGDGAYTAAGSVITSDVPPGSMAVARAPQRNVAGWVSRRRPGTPAAEAAERAEEAGRQDGEQE